MRVVSALFGCLFGLVFSVVGVFIASETLVPMVLDWQEAWSWQTDNAKLTSVRGANNFTEAEYQYSYQGRDYVSSRVYLASFHDNFGSYHSDLYSKLSRAKDNSQTIQIWLNPNNPSEAMIDRDMRWGLFAITTGFTGIFILVGLFICYVSITHKPAQDAKNKRRLNKLKREWNRNASRLLGNENPQTFSEFVTAKAPDLIAFMHESSVANNGWKERKGWETNRIRSGSFAGVVAMWVVSAFLILICYFISTKLPTTFKGFSEEIVFALVFALVGVLVILQTLKLTLRYRRFGRVEFVMDPYPGSIGGDVGGYIDVKRLPYAELDPNASQFKVTLECVYTYVSGGGKNRSRSESIKWAEEGMADVQRSASGVMLSFKFNVPEYLSESSVEQSGDYTFWRLKVYGDLPGFDLKREYNIPVFITGQTSSNIRNNISEHVSELKKEASEEKARAVREGSFHLTDLVKVATIEQFGNELLIYFPMFRNKGLSIFALIFALGFGFATYSINSQFGGGFGGIFMFLFSIPFALVALVASIAAIYLPFNNLKVKVSRTELRSARKLLFFPVSNKTISTREIVRLKLKRSGSTGQGVKKIEHFKIIAECRSASDITVAEDIDGEDLAGHFKDYLARVMNLNLKS